MGYKGNETFKINYTSKLYKTFFKSKHNQTCKIKQAAFKNYRNKITDLLQISRQYHCQKYFSDNKKTQKHYGKEYIKIFILKKLVKQTAHHLN